MALRLNSNVRDPIPYHMLMLDKVRLLAADRQGPDEPVEKDIARWPFY